MKKTYIVYMNKQCGTWVSDAYQWAKDNEFDPESKDVELISEVAFFQIFDKIYKEGQAVYFVTKIITQH